MSLIVHQNLYGALTLLFEGEVLCEMPALMVASEQEECGRVVDLQRPQEQHTLQREGKFSLENMPKGGQNSARLRDQLNTVHRWKEDPNSFVDRVPSVRFPI